jgi:hypothetical protein
VSKKWKKWKKMLGLDCASLVLFLMLFPVVCPQPLPFRCFFSVRVSFPFKDTTPSMPLTAFDLIAQYIVGMWMRHIMQYIARTIVVFAENF